MTLSELLPYSFEQQQLNAQAQFNSDQNAGLQWNEQQAANLTQIARQYPWLEPGAATGFAQANLTADHPAVQQAARTSLGQQLDTRAYAKQIFALGNADRINKAISQIPYDQMSPSQQHQMHQALDEETVRYEKQAQQGGGILGAVKSGIGDLSYSAGRALSGDIVGAVTGHPQGENPLSGSGGLASIVPGATEAAKVATRTTGLAAQTALQGAQGFVRQAAYGANQLAQGNIAQGLEPAPIGPAQQTQGGIALNEALAGQHVDVGSGWLPDPNSQTGQLQAQIARDAAPTVNGHAGTLGRYAGAVLGAAGAPVGLGFSPDSTAFNAISGAIDASFAMKADPTVNTINEFSEARKAGDFFSPNVEQANNASAETGLHLVNDGEYDPRSVDALAASSKGAEIDQRIGDEQSPFFMWLKSNKNIPIQTYGGQPVLTALADAQPGEVWDTIRQVAPAVKPSDLGNYDWSLTAAQSKYTAQFYQHSIFVHDPNTAAEQLDRYAQIGNLDLNDRAGLFDNYVRAANDPARAQAVRAYGEAVATKVAEQMGQSEHASEIARSVGNIMQRDIDQLSTYTIDQARGGEIWRPGTVRDAAGNVMATPDLEPEMLNGTISLPDPEELRQATSAYAKMFASGPWKYAEALPDAFIDLWRPLHAGRPAVALKATLDSQLSMAANGYDSLFNGGAPNVIGAMLAGLDKDKFWGGLAERSGLTGMLGKYTGDIQGEDLLKHLAPGETLNPQEAAQSQQVLSRLEHGFAGLTGDPGRVATQNFIPVSRTDPQAASAMVDELARMRSSPTVQGLLQQETPEAAKDWFHSGEGSVLREQLQPTLDAIDQANMEKYAAQRAATPGGIRATFDMPAPGDQSSVWHYGDLADRANSDAFVDSRFNSVNQRTGGDQELIDAVRTGRLGGRPMTEDEFVKEFNKYDRLTSAAEKESNPADWTPEERAANASGDWRTFSRLRGYSSKEINDFGRWLELNGADKGFDYSNVSPESIYAQHFEAGSVPKIGEQPLYKNGQPNHALDSYVQKIFDDGRGPAQVKAQQFVNTATTAGAKSRELVNWWMNAMLTVPDKTMNQIPGWKQLYWQSVQPYMRWLSPDDLADAQANAANANLPGKVLDQINRIVPTEGADRYISPDAAGYYAKNDALNKVNDIFHNVQNRSNFFDTYRFLFPFGDAFRNIASRWATNIYNNPEVLRQAQQIIQGAQQSGFFHKDPLTGQQVFTYPGSSYLTNGLLGVPVPLVGQVKGLSMIGDGYPGIGPGVTLPAQFLLPKTPQFDGVRNIIFPYGQPDQTVGTALSQEFMPSWLAKITDGPPDAKTYNNTVGYLMQSLASTGRYDLNGPNARNDLARLTHDASEDAKWIYVIRGATQAFAPSAPAPEWMAQDKSGRYVALQVIKDYYQKQIQANGPDAALGNLIDKFGPSNVFAAQSFSVPIAYGVPTTAEGQKWARSNPQYQSAYPTTYGLFAPSGGKFDITAFENQFVTGERKSLTPQDQLDAAENRVGSWLYYKMKDKLLTSNGGRPLNKATTTWLDGYRQNLTQDFPGFDSFNAQPYDSQKRRNTAIAELTAASNDQRLAGNDAWEGLNQYLQGRQQAITAAQSEGLKTPFQATRALPIRQWLRGLADAVVKDHPGFLPMWEQVFSNEMNQDVGR